jgi:hypothetical protein
MAGVLAVEDASERSHHVSALLVAQVKHAAEVLEQENAEDAIKTVLLAVARAIAATP